MSYIGLITKQMDFQLSPVSVLFACVADHLGPHKFLNAIVFSEGGGNLTPLLVVH
jgi:hypothetical protein